MWASYIRPKFMLEKEVIYQVYEIIVPIFYLFLYFLKAQLKNDGGRELITWSETGQSHIRE